MANNIGIHQIGYNHGSLFTKSLWKIAANTQTAEKPKKKHALHGVQNGQGAQRIPWKDICEIRRLFEEEFKSRSFLAEKFNCTPSYIHQITNYSCRLNK